MESAAPCYLEVKPGRGFIWKPDKQKLAGYPDTTRVIKVDVDANGDLAGSLGIQSIPFVQFYKDGKAVDQFIGVLPYEGIVEKVEAHIAKR